jgi:hydroxylamine dehydrogenase
MNSVCANCHSSRHTDGFFAQGDKAVRLYNEGYYAPATKMLEELKEKNLLKDNPWTDEFQITYYSLWHHEGRRARRGAMMGAPDYAHWHGFFELQQDLYKLKQIYQQRMESGAIE